MNKRLDKFLEEKNIISKSQIGFCKTSRTPDHMFVLKTLIDKYINKKKGGKHAGIKYKLLKLNITGKFYSIIKDMYSKNKLCVKIKNELTSIFRSFIGVRQGDVLILTIFKLFLNDMPEIFSSCTDPVDLNDNSIVYLMYAVDIVIFF